MTPDGKLEHVQDRYAGDVGDFQTFALLRTIAGERAGLRLGVCWYLTADEHHNGDGRHVGYLEPGNRLGKSLEACDPGLYTILRHLVRSGRRSVAALAGSGALPAGTVTFDDRLARRMRERERRAWHARALNSLRSADLVLLTPDNGVRPDLARPSRKHASGLEVADYTARGQSVVVYQHATRAPGGIGVQVERSLGHITEATGMRPLGAVVLRRGSARFFVVVSQPHHEDVIATRVAGFVERWRRHGELRYPRDGPPGRRPTPSPHPSSRRAPLAREVPSTTLVSSWSS